MLGNSILGGGSKIIQERVKKLEKDFNMCLINIVIKDNFMKAKRMDQVLWLYFYKTIKVVFIMGNGIWDRNMEQGNTMMVNKIAIIQDNFSIIKSKEKVFLSLVTINFMMEHL